MLPHDSKSSGYQATETPLQSPLRAANVCCLCEYSRLSPGYWDAGCCNTAGSFPRVLLTDVQRKSEADSNIHALSAGQKILPDSS